MKRQRGMYGMEMAIFTAVFWGLIVLEHQGLVTSPKSDPLRIQCKSGDRYHVPCEPGNEKETRRRTGGEDSNDGTSSSDRGW